MLSLPPSPPASSRHLPPSPAFSHLPSPTSTPPISPNLPPSPAFSHLPTPNLPQVLVGRPPISRPSRSNIGSTTQSSGGVVVAPGPRSAPARSLARPRTATASLPTLNSPYNRKPQLPRPASAIPPHERDQIAMLREKFPNGPPPNMHPNGPPPNMHPDRIPRSSIPAYRAGLIGKARYAPRALARGQAAALACL